MLSRKRPASRPRQPGLCFSCGEVGHYANSCPKRRARPGAGAADAADTAGPADSNSDVKRELPSFLAQHRYRPTGDSSAGAARKGRVLVPEQTEEAKPSPDLSVEQRRVVDLVLDGHNVFFTGNGARCRPPRRCVCALTRPAPQREPASRSRCARSCACCAPGTPRRRCTSPPPPASPPATWAAPPSTPSPASASAATARTSWSPRSCATAGRRPAGGLRAPSSSTRSPCWTGTSSTRSTRWPSASATARSPSAACS